MKQFKKLLFALMIKYKIIEKGDMGNIIISVGREGVTDIKCDYFKPNKWNDLETMTRDEF